jgi:hypothetical protein
MAVFRKIAATAAVSLGIGLAAAGALAQPMAMGHGMMHGMSGAAGEFRGPMAGRMQQDEAFAADMQLVRTLVHGNTRIERSVTNLPDGIRTVTESDDPQIAQAIKAHVASMMQRLDEGRTFNLFSRTLPVLFENRNTIKTTVETTARGSIVTQTSTDTRVVTALQEHAGEVDELVRDGMVAMMRNMRGGMAMMGGRGPHSAFSR